MNRVLLFTFFIFSTQLLLSQSEGRVHNSSWNTLVVKGKLSEKWGVGNELHVRRTHFMAENEQLIIRPWVDYNINKNLQLAAGYSYIENYHHRELTQPIDTHEDNVWVQLKLKQKLEKMSFGHRFRFEHRWFETPVFVNDEFVIADEKTTNNRFRYQLAFNVPFKRFESGKVLSIDVNDEVFLNMHDGLRVVGLNQNWVFVGLKAKLSDKVSIKSGYHDIVLPTGNPDEPRINHIWETFLVISL